MSCAEAGLGLAEAMGFSFLVFTGGTQFAAVEVLDDGGTAAAALAAGLLLSLRSLAYGVVMAPALGERPRWWRALVSQWMIDETMAVGAAPGRPGGPALRVPADRRPAVFVLWNLATAAGALLS